MARWLYTLLYYLLLPLILLRLWYRGLKAPAYRRRVFERLGFFKAPNLNQPIWVHAVSVGETIAAKPLIEQLQQRYPNRSIVVTTMTPTGSERVRALFGDSVFHVYAPYDLPGAIKRFLRKVKPSLLIIMETELWPNTIHYCHRSDVPVLLANARLSAKSALGYQNFSALTRPMLQKLSMVVAQTGADANRFNILGLPENSQIVSGSIKFDISIDEALRAKAGQLKQQWGSDRPVWIAASTHEGEDEWILDAYSELAQSFAQLLLVIVPRHPERFDQVAELVQRRGLRFQRRSAQHVPLPETQVVVGDTMGELLLLFGVSDIAFVGGSLVENGGHNMLEPAAWGVPIITGQSDFNFLAISELLQQQGGLVKVSDVTAMVVQLRVWLASAEARGNAGAAAAKVVQDNRGALNKLIEEIERWL